MGYNNENVGDLFGVMLLFVKPAPLILQIKYILKYLDLSDTI